MDPVLLGIGAAAGVVAVAATQGGKGMPAAGGGTGAVEAREVQILQEAAPSSFVDSLRTAKRTGGPIFDAKQPDPAGTGYPQEVLDLAKQAMIEEFDRMSGEARRKACERLKAEFPSDPSIQAIDCSSAGFQIILNACAAAAGVAICGPTCGALAVMATAYFGRDLEAWAGEAWAKIKDAAEEAWDWVAEGARDAWDGTLGRVF